MIVQFSSLRARTVFVCPRSINRDAVENIRVEADQMPVAQIVRLGAQNFFDLFRQRVNETRAREPHIDLVLFFFRNAADLQHLPLLVLVAKNRDRAPGLGQAIRMQIAAIVGHELLDVRWS